MSTVSKRDKRVNSALFRLFHALLTVAIAAWAMFGDKPLDEAVVPACLFNLAVLALSLSGAVVRLESES